MANERLSDIGIVVMGVMGNNLLLNINDHCFVTRRRFLELCSKVVF